MRVKLDNIVKEFGKTRVVDEISLEINDGEFVAFLGPSGCGKTTTLLMTTGIYQPTGGNIYFDDKIVNKVKPKDRDIGMVFQSYALYPHMSVFDNIVFSMRLKKTPMATMKQEAQRIADMMGIGHLLDRMPSQLSGGQQQRVALGRALIKQPSLLLFDEPLSNLDARLRITMRSEIKRLQNELGITSIYVTHDQMEAMTMADRVAVMKDGKLQAYMPPEELHNKPRNLFVAQFVGNPPMNTVHTELIKEENKVMIGLAGGFKAEVPASRMPEKSDKKVIWGIRPEDITIGNDQGIETEIEFIEPMGRDDLLVFRINNQAMTMLADPGLKLKINDRIKVNFDMDKSQFFDPDTELSLLWT